jgi:hypothetical protein
MKHSHLVTPRSLNDCSFTTGYTTGPTDRQTGYSRVWWACMGVIALVTVIVIAATNGAPQ